MNTKLRLWLFPSLYIYELHEHQTANTNDSYNWCHMNLHFWKVLTTKIGLADITLNKECTQIQNINFNNCFHLYFYKLWVYYEWCAHFHPSLGTWKWGVFHCSADLCYWWGQTEFFRCIHSAGYPRKWQSSALCPGSLPHWRRFRERHCRSTSRTSCRWRYRTWSKHRDSHS